MTKVATTLLGSALRGSCTSSGATGAAPLMGVAATRLILGFLISIVSNSSVFLGHASRGAATGTIGAPLIGTRGAAKTTLLPPVASIGASKAGAGAGAPAARSARGCCAGAASAGTEAGSGSAGATTGCLRFFVLRKGGVVVSGVELFSLSLLRLFSRLADGGNNFFLSLVFSPGSAKNKQKANASLLRCFALLFPSSSARSSLSLRQRGMDKRREGESERRGILSRRPLLPRARRGLRFLFSGVLVALAPPASCSRPLPRGSHQGQPGPSARR